MLDRAGKKTYSATSLIYNLEVMKYQLFSEAGLLVLECGGKKSLFRVENEGHLQPIGFAQNLTHLEVYPEYKILLTDFEIRTFDGIPLSKYVYGKTDIVPMQDSYVWVIGEMWGNDYFLIVLKDGQMVNSQHCRQIIWSDKYAVLTVEQADHTPICKILSYDGTEILQLVATQTRLCGDFAIVGSMSNYQLYSLKRGKLLKDNQQLIIASEKSDFAICCTIAGVAKAYYNGRWRSLGEVREALIVADALQLYAIARHGKYHLFNYDGKPYLADVYPDGVDFAGYDEKTRKLLIVNDSHGSFI